MFLRRLSLLLPLIALCGCGGGGKGGNGSSPSGTFASGETFKIVWPSRSRVDIVHGLTSALSARITLASAGTSGGNVTFDAIRSTDPAGYTGTYTLPVAIKASAGTFTVAFFGTTDESGPEVGTAAGTYVPANKDLGIATVAVSGTIKHVTPLSPGTLTAGAASVQLTASADDGAGTTIAVSAGSFSWSVPSGSNVLSVTPDGIATPLIQGSAQIEVTVDGIVSTPVTVGVQAPGPSTLTLATEANDLAYDATSGRIWAIVPANAAANPNSLVGLDPATGNVVQTISLGVEASHLAITDDGQFAYVEVDGDRTVRRVDLTAGTVSTIYHVDEGRAYTDLVAVPGQPHSFVVAIDPTQGVNVSVWDDGVRRSGTGAGGTTLHFANDGATIYGDGSDSLFTDVISTGQIMWTNQTSLSVAGFDYSKADGLIYTANGRAYDPVSKTLIAQLSTADVLFDKGVRVGEADNRIYFVTWDSGTPKRILTFDRTSKSELPLYDTGVLTGGAQDLVACGNHTVAFHLFGIGVSKKVVLVRNLP